MKVGIIQFDYGISNRADRVAKIEKQIQLLSSNDLIVLPEMWVLGFQDSNVSQDSAEWSLFVLDKLKQLAINAHTYIHCGSMLELENDCFYNTTHVINPCGETISKYRKIHLFSLQSSESKVFTAGNELQIVTICGLRLGLVTCYDIRFPELFRKYLDKEVEGFIVTAAWPISRIDAWMLLCRTRALENQSYIIACNGSGFDAELRLGGNSCIIDPLGKIVEVAGEKSGELIATLSGDKVRAVRKTFPFLGDRRKDYDQITVVDSEE